MNAADHRWISKALLALAPGAEWVVRGAEIEWLDENISRPSDLQIEEKASQLKSNNEIDMLRQERNRRLAETDWWVLPDRSPTALQLAYRESLRDITNTYSSLDDVVWPDKPE